ncbi:GNAT family N-acetyltransferase [Candidatus Woesearchaeota archaeon]|nr:GNAT family N-acetyltransferase [Candidatus Woesearchaeota archaeon]
MTLTWLLKARQKGLERELPKVNFLRSTRKLGRNIYAFTMEQSRRSMRIVGRLREVSFRHAGGGTGKVKDIDAHDRHKTNPYTQLIVWDQQDRQIVGGYRYQLWRNAPRDKQGNLDVSTTHYFNFSERFMEAYAPYVIELGRSFVTPEYQARNRKSIYSLDNLWDGLGTLIVMYPDMRYFFGKITLYPDKNPHSKPFIYALLDKHFRDEEGLLTPKPKLAVDEKDHETLERLLKDVPDDINKQLGFLGKYVIDHFKEQIPPLFSSYAKLSGKMKVFGTAVNKDFGNVEETAILIPIKEIDPKMLERYTNF